MADRDERGREALAEAIAVVEDSRRTHVEWLNYLTGLRESGCADCIKDADRKAMIAGGEDHQRQCIQGYDKVLAVLRGRMAHDADVAAALRDAVVHVTEIRLREDDPWDVCDVGVYSLGEGPEPTIADLSDRLDRELDRQGETERKRWVTRTLGSGLLREVRVETIHRGGKSYFRHRIMRSDNSWLTKRADESNPR